MIKFLKIFCAAGFLVVLVNNIVSMSGWTESRAVYDDICYLRQAHLFERFGLGGIDTDIARDDDHYLQDKLRSTSRPGMIRRRRPVTPSSWRRASGCCSILRAPALCFRYSQLAFR